MLVGRGQHLLRRESELPSKSLIGPMSRTWAARYYDSLTPLFEIFPRRHAAYQWRDGFLLEPLVGLDTKPLDLE